MAEFEGASADQTPAANVASVDGATVNTFAAGVPAPVDPVRSAAGRLGAQRRQQLIRYGEQYEREHHLTPGRQRLRQLVQLGKRYEQEHGFGAAKPRRVRRGDAWVEFLAALARVVKPAHRPAVERLAATVAESGAGARGSENP